ncbi:PHP domain-containing protein [Garciella nitratireducens]|uniref:Putative hydrolase n=1 Tax=Garciella nitratireducens DSM 15102 TaxID=1121911 RepID=A0A1T4NRR6_9FIRM|nr:PHP domain-containing protein [Garciella nitratireducens]SJZ81817.1 putative hydrolase [Garciella nitratireducens DSM 15102]
MKIIADYHTHTIYSHGKGSIMDNVMIAKKKGLKKIAIADHGPKHISFGVKIKEFSKMRREIDQINDTIKGIEVLMGIESNIIGKDGTIDVPKEFLELFDIILAGYHYATYPASWKDVYPLTIVNGLGKLSKSWVKKAEKINTDAIIQAMERYPIQIITHPGAKIPIDTHRLAQAAVKTNTWLEINASHGYLSKEMIEIAKEHNVKFVISSDAHIPEMVGEVEKGILTAQSAGLTARDIVNAKEGE